MGNRLGGCFLPVQPHTLQVSNRQQLPKPYRDEPQVIVLLYNSFQKTSRWILKSPDQRRAVSAVEERT